MKCTLKDGYDFNRQRWWNELFPEVDMGGFIFKEKQQRGLCWCLDWDDQDWTSSGIKDQIERSPRRGRNGKSVIFFDTEAGELPPGGGHSGRKRALSV